MKKFFAILAALCLLLSAFGAQAEAVESPAEPLSVTLDVLNRGAEAFYGCDVNISIKDFIALGFELGDACNVVLENDLTAIIPKPAIRCSAATAMPSRKSGERITSTPVPIIRISVSATTTGKCGTCCI